MHINTPAGELEITRGLTTGEIFAHFAEVYGASISKDTVSTITDTVIEEMTEWCHRPLDRPVTDRAPLGPGTVAWDLNYRGDLTFLRQATARGSSIVDGWDYFVAGWAGALTTIAGVPFSPHVLSALATAAAPHRPTGVSS